MARIERFTYFRLEYLCFVKTLRIFAENYFSNNFDLFPNSAVKLGQDHIQRIDISY